MLLAASPPRTLGVAEGARVRFVEESKPDGAWAGRRLLLLDEVPAFELSFWCGTCQFLFTRLEGASETVSLEELCERLSDGLEVIEDGIVERFAQLLPEGTYIPMLLQIQPRLVVPAGEDDYFANEQVATWNLQGFWGLPHYPQTPYYRTFETVVGRATEQSVPDAHLYEFVVPMVPPSWNEPDRVAQLAERLAESAAPTAVAVSTLDISRPEGSPGADNYQHWGLTHFLLDGHHKLHAAAQLGRPLQLLTLLSIDASLAAPNQVHLVPELLAQRARRRHVSD